jgi:hypothetical protein
MSFRLNHRNHCVETKLLEMSATNVQKPIEPISETLSIRYRDKESSSWLENPLYLPNRFQKVPKVLQAMMADDKVKCAANKRQIVSICLDNPYGAVPKTVRRRQEVNRDHLCGEQFVIETPRACAKVQNSLRLLESAKPFVEKIH